MDQVKVIIPFTPEEVDQLEILLGHIESPLLDHLINMATAWPVVTAMAELWVAIARVTRNHWEEVFEYEEMISDLKERVRLLLPPDERPRYRYFWDLPEEAFIYLGPCGKYDLLMVQHSTEEPSFQARFGDEMYEVLEWSEPPVQEAKRRAIDRGLYKE